MKKAIIRASHNVDVQTIPDPQSMRKIVQVYAPELEISDGYHTMDELYDHRIRLYIQLCKSVQYANLLEIANNPYTPKVEVWRSKTHLDGFSYDGWFLLGIGKEKGKTITCHLPNAHWDECDFAEILERAPEWDGHTSADVLERLKLL